MPFIANYMRKRKSQELGQTRLFGGVDRMLRELTDAGTALALVTSNSEPNARAILGADNANLIRTYECGVSMFGNKLKELERQQRMQQQQQSTTTTTQQLVVPVTR